MNVHDPASGHGGGARRLRLPALPADLPALKGRVALAAAVMLLWLGGGLEDGPAALLLTAAAYVAVAWEAAGRAVRHFLRARRMNEQFLMVLASAGALALHDYPEALAIMVFYLIGKAFEDYAARRARTDITALISLRPAFARLMGGAGEAVRRVRPQTVAVGDRLLVLSGDAVPLDGRLCSAEAALNLAALTGESRPVQLQRGAAVPSGALNLGRPFELEVTAVWADSQLQRLIELIEDAAASRSAPETLITRFSAWYTPAVVTLAAALALTGVVLPGESAADWLERALVFLVLSCPCALVLSVPLTFFGGLGALSRLGVMAKGSAQLEQLARIRTLALDKTGTLTCGRFTVGDVQAADGTAEGERELLEVLAALEAGSGHPLGQAVRGCCEARGLTPSPASALEEHPGQGLSGLIAGERCLAGTARYLREAAGAEVPQVAERDHCTIIHSVRGQRYLGCVTLSDVLRPGAADFIAGLRALDIHPVMLSGDAASAAARAAEAAGIAEVHARLLPADKAAAVDELRRRRGATGFMGDGINDGPALAAADVGIAMGQEGTALAAEVAGIVVMHERLGHIAAAIATARRTVRLALHNMALVMGVKLLILALGAMGLAGIWLAILGDVGLLVLSVLNAMRTLTWCRTPAAAADPWRSDPA